MSTKQCDDAIKTFNTKCDGTAWFFRSNQYEEFFYICSF